MGKRSVFVLAALLMFAAPISLAAEETATGGAGMSAEDEAALAEGSANFEFVSWDESWPYASNSMIHESDVKLYHAADPCGIVICVNAGHGTSGGESVQTLSHPDGTGKVTGGTNAEGAVYSMAVSSGTTFLDGSTERDANLQIAMILKEKLLAEGYDVLMIRESEDVRLDNIARTCFANRYADAHIALHYDSTDYDKGFYYMGVPNVESYRSMEPVSEYWRWHEALGEALVKAVSESGLKVYESGRLETDLTQTSYSTIPSLDVELGDRGSDHSYAVQEQLAGALVKGLNDFFADRR